MDLYECDVCGKTFLSPFALNGHVGTCPVHPRTRLEGAQ